MAVKGDCRVALNVKMKEQNYQHVKPSHDVNLQD